MISTPPFIIIPSASPTPPRIPQQPPQQQPQQQPPPQPVSPPPPPQQQKQQQQKQQTDSKHTAAEPSPLLLSLLVCPSLSLRGAHTALFPLERFSRARGGGAPSAKPTSSPRAVERVWWTKILSLEGL